MVFMSNIDYYMYKWKEISEDKGLFSYVTIEISPEYNVESFITWIDLKNIDYYIQDNNRIRLPNYNIYFPYIPSLNPEDYF